MSLETLYFLSSIVAAVGVIASLIFVGLQMRQNAIAAKATAVNASNLALRENRQAIFTSTELSDLFLRGNAGPTGLSELDQLRYRSMLMNIVESLFDVYSQNFETGFSPEVWESQGKTTVERILGTPGGEWFWRNYANSYPPAFRREVNKILEQYDASSEYKSTQDGSVLGF